MEVETLNIKLGQVRDSNKIMFKSLLREMGTLSVLDFGSVADDPDALKAAFLQASEKCDVLISSGGVSMGELDFVKPFLA